MLCVLILPLGEDAAATPDDEPYACDLSCAGAVGDAPDLDSTPPPPADLAYPLPPPPPPLALARGEEGGSAGAFPGGSELL